MVRIFDLKIEEEIEVEGSECTASGRLSGLTRSQQQHISPGDGGMNSEIEFEPAFVHQPCADNFQSHPR